MDPSAPMTSSLEDLSYSSKDESRSLIEAICSPPVGVLGCFEQSSWSGVAPVC